MAGWLVYCCSGRNTCSSTCSIKSSTNTTTLHGRLTVLATPTDLRSLGTLYRLTYERCTPLSLSLLVSVCLSVCLSLYVSLIHRTCRVLTTVCLPIYCVMTMLAAWRLKAHPACCSYPQSHLVIHRQTRNNSKKECQLHKNLIHDDNTASADVKTTCLTFSFDPFYSLDIKCDTGKL